MKQDSTSNVINEEREEYKSELRAAAAAADKSSSDINKRSSLTNNYNEAPVAQIKLGKRFTSKQNVTEMAAASSTTNAD